MSNSNNVKILTMIANEDLRDLQGSLLKLVVVDGETRVTRTTVAAEDAQFILHSTHSYGSTLGEPVTVVQLRIGGIFPVRVANGVTVTANQYAIASAASPGTVASTSTETAGQFPLGIIAKTITGGINTTVPVHLVSIHRSKLF